MSVSEGDEAGVVFDRGTVREDGGFRKEKGSGTHT
jgi:hypothetical protein